jgi:outer membrane protein assembly factor BamE (lipoprotein component of BamABCDE complex)
VPNVICNRGEWKEKVLKESLRKTILKSVMVISSVVLIGFASSGNKQIIKDEIISQIKVGESTKSGIITLLGRPQQAAYDGEGEEFWIYAYARGAPDATILIPFVGPHVAGFNAISYSLRIHFTKEGTVKQIVKDKREGKLRGRDLKDME